MGSGQAINRNDEFDLIMLLRLIWDLKYVVALITALFGIMAVVTALTATPVFRAEAVVREVDDPNMDGASSLASQFGGLASLAGVNFRPGGSGRNFQAVLESRNLVEEFLVRNDLVSVLSPADGEPLTLWLAVKRFRENVLKIVKDEDKGTSKVIVAWTDPNIAADWANGFVALANETIRARARQDSERNIEYLNKQVEESSVVELQKVMYNLIENETKTLMLANARAEYAFAVVDTAVAPEIRFSPKRKLIVVSGIAIGFFVAMLFVLAYSLYRRVRAEHKHGENRLATE